MVSARQVTLSPSEASAHSPCPVRRAQMSSPVCTILHLPPAKLNRTGAAVCSQRPALTSLKDPEPHKQSPYLHRLFSSASYWAGTTLWPQPGAAPAPPSRLRKRLCLLKSCGSDFLQPREPVLLQGDEGGHRLPSFLVCPPCPIACRPPGGSPAYTCVSHLTPEQVSLESQIPATGKGGGTASAVPPGAAAGGAGTDLQHPPITLPRDAAVLGASSTCLLTPHFHFTKEVEIRSKPFNNIAKFSGL